MIYEGMAKRPIHPGYERRTYNFAVRPPVTWVGEETLTKLRLLGNIIAIDMKYRSIKVSGAYRQSKKSAAGE